MRNKRILMFAERNELDNEILQRSVEIFLSSLSGMITFPAVIGIMQHLVLKPCGVAAHLRLAPVYGAVSLMAASACSAMAFTLVQSQLNQNVVPIFIGSNTKETMFNITSYGALSFIAFKIVGGRLKSLCPSHILNPGSFAVEGVKLSSVTSRVTKSHQEKIQLLGEKYGCHTCGKKYYFLGSLVSKFWKTLARRPRSRIRVDYFADHNPPVALAEKYLKKNKSIVGTLYPQCKSCSYFQASQVRLAQANQLKNHSAIITHATRMQMHKLWLPLPILFQYGLMHANLSDLFR